MLVAGVDCQPEQRQEYLKLFTDYYYDMINTDKHKYTLTNLGHFYLYPTPDDIESLRPKRKGIDLSEFAWC
jgi:tricorn protease-like protein